MVKIVKLGQTKFNFGLKSGNFVEILKFHGLVWFSMVWYGLVWSIRLKIHNHQSVTKVGIELLGQLKKYNLPVPARSSRADRRDHRHRDRRVYERG